MGIHQIQLHYPTDLYTQTTIKTDSTQKHCGKHSHKRHFDLID